MTLTKPIIEWEFTKHLYSHLILLIPLGKPRSRHPPGRCTRSDSPLVLSHLSDAPAFQGGAFLTPHPHDLSLTVTASMVAEGLAEATGYECA